MAELELEAKSPGSSLLWLSVFPEEKHKLSLARRAYAGTALLTSLDAGGGRQRSALFACLRRVFWLMKAQIELDKVHYKKEGGAVGKRYYDVPLRKLWP